MTEEVKDLIFNSLALCALAGLAVVSFRLERNRRASLTRIERAEEDAKDTWPPF